MKLIIGSREDKASMNIVSNLLGFDEFEKKKAGDCTFYIGDEFAIAEVNERLIYADFIDERLSNFLDFDEILFVSRHSSRDERKIFTCHVSGNPGRNAYGGKPRSLARPSPITVKNFMLAMKKRMERKPDFELTLEATHHGPSEIKKPSAFYEIGSTEREWTDKEAGEIVAEAIVEAIKSKKSEWKVAVGIGGTHYVPRQTEIILETEFTFGHNFAKYTFEELDLEIIKRAIEVSSANFLIYDEKSVVSEVKKLISSIDGVEVLKSKEAKRFKLKEP